MHCVLLILTFDVYALYIPQVALYFPGSSNGKESACSAGEVGSVAGFGSGFHGQRSLVGYSPWGHRVGYNLATKQQLTNYTEIYHKLMNMSPS